MRWETCGAPEVVGSGKKRFRLPGQLGALKDAHLSERDAGRVATCGTPSGVINFRALGANDFVRTMNIRVTDGSSTSR